MNMAYNNKFVVTVIQNNHIMKELANGSVNIEFGEYKIRLRNKHNRRAICKLYIDGENVSGGGFIISENSHIDIERPVDVARKFKFVTLDSEEAHDYGKNGPNLDKIKGTIIAEFALEKEVFHQPVKDYWYSPGFFNQPQMIGCSINTFNKRSNRHITGSLCMDSLSEMESNNISATGVQYNKKSEYLNLNDGATVEGSYSSQKFRSTIFDHENNWSTIRLFLQGYEPQVKLRSGEVDNKIGSKTESFLKDQELINLEKELLELQKQKTKKEIEKLKLELA